MDILALAKLVHETNRLICEAAGDNSQPSWEEAPDWQREATFDLIYSIGDDPDRAGRNVHKKWMAKKIADGWVHGDEKNAEKKTHPCLVPYNELPQEQKAKDIILATIVTSLLTTMGRYS